VTEAELFRGETKSPPEEIKTNSVATNVSRRESFYDGDGKCAQDKRILISQ